MGTLDEQIEQALNRALGSLHRHIEADLSSLTRDLMAAADIARGEAAAEASAAAAAEAWRQAEAQMSQLKDEARVQLADVRTAMQQKMEDARRAAQASADDARRAAAADASALRQKIVALETELDLAKSQAHVDLDRAQKEIATLRRHSQSLAEDVLIEQIEETEAAGQCRVDAAVERARIDAHQAELAAAARMVNGIRCIDEARSLGDVLTAFERAAAGECERAGVLIVKDDTLRGWRFSGFTTEMGSRPGAVVVPRDTPGLLGRVAAKGVADVVSPQAAANGDGALPEFARGAGARHAVAMPVGVGGEVVAVLYADATRSDVPSSACRWPAALEVFARHASRALEALTVQQAAGLTPVMTSTPLSRKSLPGPVEQGGTGDDDTARRYARLLVSEIRMYHEPAVDAARRTRDLRVRLGGEIDRARRLYEERVPEGVRQAVDYFEQELVRTLADGDRTLLG